MDHTQILIASQNDAPSTIRYLISQIILAALTKLPQLKREAEYAALSSSSRTILAEKPFAFIMKIITI
ncbi:hypothetical protein [Marinobacter alexandrii]|uniref:hypothetical protein n=1 Tax=Marinobacter alexandrii TaxID=2570351 RepID=UPI0011090BF1|nr:hypothetical protein [Marinobacter alexandrii]